MSIRFAGSRCVDERRRRRLAQEADGHELPDGPTARRVAIRKVDPAGDGRLPRGSTPADTLISPKLWKHALVGLTATLVWLAVLLIGDRADQARSGIEGIVGLAQGKLTTFFSTVMLLAAGQLAFITLWYRSRSRKDFNGSYKLWFWTAVAWLTMCALQASGAHWSLADAVLAGRPVAIWNVRMILWMIPAAITFVTLFVLLRREMRDCRGSLWALRLAGAVALANGLVLLFGQFGLEARGRNLAEAGLSMAWHLLLAFSMLLHARHVIHISNELPTSPIVRFEWSRLLPWRLWSRRGGASPARRVKSAATEGAKPSARKSTSSKKRSTARRRTATTPIAESDDEVQTADETSQTEAAEWESEPEVDAEFEAPVEPVKTPAPQAVRRVDPPQPAAAAPKPHFTAPATPPANKAPSSKVDADEEWSDDDDETDDDGRPLSKKERRRMKKLQRQQGR